MNATGIARWRVGLVMIALVMLAAPDGGRPPSAQTSFCPPTGNESIGPDKGHYRPDEVAQIAGSGFLASCDVRVVILAPDGTMATSVVTTGEAGQFAYAHLLGDLAGEYSVAFFGEADVEITAVTFTNGPVVMLDKGDYRTNETVHVMGEGYIPFETLTVQVTRPDGSIVTGNGTEAPGSDAVGADADGKFTYDYIIRNGVVADYLVDILGSSGISLAGTSFTDSGNFVQNLGTASVTGLGTTTSITILPVTGTVTPGNSIIVGFAGSNANIAVSCSDSKGNAYTTDITRVGVNGSVSICSTHGIPAAKVLVAAVDTITVTFAAGGSNRSVTANEFSGLEATGTLDKTQSANANNNSPSSGATAATSQADEILFGAIWFSGSTAATFAAGSGACTGNPTGTYTLTNPVIGNGLGGGLIRPLATEYRVATATGTYAACGTLSIGNQWAAAIATYKVAPTPKLTVKKIVDNTGGGTKQEGDFPLFLDGNPVVSGQQNTTTVGSHTVSETQDPNYTAVIGGDCAPDGTITLAATDVKTCTITNTFKAPKLTVQKVVDNTGGGTKQPGDFPLFVDGTPVTNNQQITTTVGPHTVSETVDPNYTATIGGDCAVNGSITLAAGDVKTCTITNTFKAPKLTVQKLVNNAGGGTKQPGDFPLFVDGTPVTNNQQITTTVGPHTASETADPNYTAVIGGDCAANGSITLAAGDVKTCTITNTFNAAPTATLIVVKHVVSNNGGTKNAGNFTMQVTGSGASPSSFPGSESGTTVTLNAGAYSVAEVAVVNYFATFSADCSGTIAAGETRTCTVTNNDFRPAPPTFCQKTAVTSLLSPSNRRFLNNKGIDNLVRVDLGESIQNAVDTAADTNGDGYILIGVIANATGALGGHTSQTVVINRAYALPFALIGCSVTLHDPNRGDGQPTARIAASASSPTTPNNPANILVMDLHASDSDAAGWLVEGNGRELHNVSVSGNAAGISVVGDRNTLHNAVVSGNQGIGISVLGHDNLLDTPNVTKSASHGIQVTGDRNQVLKAIAGDKDKGNQGDGIRVGGVGNLLLDNRANANGGKGFDVSGGTSVGPNRLKNNQSNSAASGTENGGGEYVLLNYVKNDGGGNRADGIVVPKTSAPVKCPAFPAANATVNFPSASVCE
jgi:hypothetical protein